MIPGQRGKWVIMSCFSIFSANRDDTAVTMFQKQFGINNLNVQTETDRRKKQLCSSASIYILVGLNLV